MNYDIPEEFQALKALAARFVERELLPLEAEVDRSGYLSREIFLRLRRLAIEVGLFGANMPEEVGGPGLPYLGQVIIREELGKVSVALAETVGRPPRSLLACQGSQRDRFLAPAMNGTKTWAFALTEPQAGSDAGALKTRAVAEGNGYRINGTKHFISNGDTADFIIVIARVPSVGEDALTAFLVEQGMPGFSVGRVHPKMGWRGSTLAELVFDDLLVPAENRLGGVGEGLRLAMGHIGEARIGVAAHCVGMGQRALDLAVEHARNRVQFKRPIGAFQGLQWMLAEMALSVEHSRCLLYAAARTMDRKDEDSRAAVSMAKLSATEMASSVADRAIQILGGAGYVAESPVEMIYRDARAFRIGEGTSEIQKNQIARCLLGKEVVA